jgi:transcriptional regulator with XRE-family HTH domain
MKSNITQATGDIIRQLREDRQLPLRKIAAILDIDTSYYSKIERNEKKATKEQIQKLEAFFEVQKNSLIMIRNSFFPMIMILKSSTSQKLISAITK